MSELLCLVIFSLFLLLETTSAFKPKCVLVRTKRREAQRFAVLFLAEKGTGGGHVRSLKREDDPNAKDYEYPSVS
jgi:hypothetical protein